MMLRMRTMTKRITKFDHRRDDVYRFENCFDFDSNSVVEMRMFRRRNGDYYFSFSVLRI
jgi:hypothetical protein